MPPRKLRYYVKTFGASRFELVYVGTGRYPTEKRVALFETLEDAYRAAADYEGLDLKGYVARLRTETGAAFDFSFLLPEGSR